MYTHIIVRYCKRGMIVLGLHCDSLLCFLDILKRSSTVQKYVSLYKTLSFYIFAAFGLFTSFHETENVTSLPRATFLFTYCSPAALQSSDRTRVQAGSLSTPDSICWWSTPDTPPVGGHGAAMRRGLV